MSYSARSKNPFDDEDDYKFGNRNQQNDEDLRIIQDKINRTENDSLESTYRALRTLNETQEIGAKTAQELVEQGEKLRNIDEKLDDVNNTLNSTQKNLNQIKSIFGGLKNKFFKGSNPKSSAEKEKQNEKMRASQTVNSLKSFNEPKAEFVEITGSDREKELNRNLDEMSLGLKRLANMGLEMQFELDRQNRTISNITDKATRTDDRITQQNQQMKKILKN